MESAFKIHTIHEVPATCIKPRSCSLDLPGWPHCPLRCCTRKEANGDSQAWANALSLTAGTTYLRSSPELAFMVRTSTCWQIYTQRPYGGGNYQCWFTLAQFLFPEYPVSEPILGIFSLFALPQSSIGRFKMPVYGNRLKIRKHSVVISLGI